MLKNTSNRKLIRNIFAYVFPVQVFSGIIMFVQSIFDLILVGNYLGETNLAIIGLVYPIGMTITFIGAVIACGSQYLSGNAMGRGESDGVHGAFSNAILLSAVFGALTALICFALSKNIPAWFGVNDEEMMGSFTEYLMGMCIGFPFTIFFQTQLTFLEMDSARSCAFVSIIAMIISKIFFDIISIFVLQNGMFGIGLATSISYVVAALIGIAFFCFRCKSFRFKIKSISLSMCLATITKGFPGGLQTLASVIFGAVLNALAMHYGGTQGVSILTVAMNAAEPFIGTAAAAFTTAGVVLCVFASRHDIASIKSTCVVSIIASWITTAIFSVALLFFSKPFVALFGLSSESIPVAARATRNLLLCGFFCWGKLLHLALYKSMGLVKKASTCCLVALIIIPCVSSSLLCLFFGLDGLWYCYPVESFLSMVVFFIMRTIKIKRIPFKMEEWVSIPSGFDVSPENRLDVTIEDLNDVTNISKKLIEFSKQHKIDSKRSFFSGLCVEEMADNIFRHNIEKNKSVTAELRVIIKEDELLITLYDNGKPFNLSEYIEMMNGVDVADNIGIKLVSKIAKEIRYSAPFGFNMLSIRI